MREVTDAKIVKIIEVDSCLHCPCYRYVKDDNVYHCTMLLMCDSSTVPNNVLLDDLIWSKCPLPTAMCTEVEEKEP